MDLHGIVSGAIQSVNRNVPLQLKRSTGYTANADGSRTPTYAPILTVSGQVQPLSSKDLRQINGLNLQGTLQAIYFYGLVQDVVRSLQKGGDLATDTSGNVWLVSMMLEVWPQWCKAVATLQNGS